MPDEPLNPPGDESVPPPPEDEGPATPPEGVPMPGGAASPPARIWDPKAGRWVSEDELSPVADSPVAAAEPAPAPVASTTYVQRPGPLPLIVAGALGAVLAVVAMLFFPGVVDRPSTRPGRPATSSGNGGFDAAALIDRARPAIVNVTSRGGEPPQRAGSGVVVKPEGIIVTTATLVQGADQVTVTFSSGLAVRAEVLGADEVTDVATLRVRESDLASLSVGTVEFLRPGQQAVAVATPAEMFAVTSAGIVSSVGRPVRTPDRLYTDMIQIDSNLPATGAGGALLDEGGSLIGLVSAVSEGTGGGYAIPIDIVMDVAEQMEGGSSDIEHPWLGILATPIDEATGLDIEDARGVVVAIVLPESPAADAGIRPADVIVGIGDEAIEGTMTLTTRLLEASPGDTLELNIIRGSSLEDIAVEVADRPDSL